MQCADLRLLIPLPGRLLADEESLCGVQPLGRVALYPLAKKYDTITKAELEGKVFKWKGAHLRAWRKAQESFVPAGLRNARGLAAVCVERWR
jgi:hypothetical protein